MSLAVERQWPDSDSRDGQEQIQEMAKIQVP